MEMIDKELDRIEHKLVMDHAMAWNEMWIGVPYGPALCQTHPSNLAGLEALL
jgi:hypothetical protein